MRNSALHSRFIHQGSRSVSCEVLYQSDLHYNLASISASPPAGTGRGCSWIKTREEREITHAHTLTRRAELKAGFHPLCACGFGPGSKKKNSLVKTTIKCPWLAAAIPTGKLHWQGKKVRKKQKKEREREGVGLRWQAVSGDVPSFDSC